MPLPDKQPPTATQVARHVERALAERIPPGWSLYARTEAPTGRYQVDLLAEIASPAGATAVLAIEIKRTLEPRGVLQAVEQISTITNRALPRVVPVVAASYLSPTRPCHPSRPRRRLHRHYGQCSYRSFDAGTVHFCRRGRSRSLAEGSQAPIVAGPGCRTCREGHRGHNSPVRCPRAGAVDQRVGSDLVARVGLARTGSHRDPRARSRIGCRLAGRDSAVD